MRVPTFHVSISGNVIALYAAVLATITAIVQALTYLRDRTRVLVSAQTDMEMVGDPRYHGMTLVIGRVANAGRRPVTITGIGARRLYPRKAFIAVDSVPAVPCELTEGKYMTALIEQDAALDLPHIECWQAWDALGRSYSRRVAPLHKYWLSRARRRFRRGRPTIAAGAK